ncbi:hypothetical protein NLG97_g4632 [Lecanicillium saksenae]|uniref:Uncharacterized protein n=1 Tax=Lecanicillium saksenae TaxID=468837 RepID=A0ACC1QW28_9HYPO|nr:hypothetical protein NLG97_g4632 [Lecanicillium saksenae]
MTHAWLDSLSEDWPSEHGSDASEAQLPPLKPHADVTPSKIPRRAGANPIYSPITGNSSHILNERTANEINISHNKLPSKLSRELKMDSKDSRSVSAATCGSVVHKTADSRAENREATPEWKRRLIHGDVAYGEQRDLFCSAATGLQDMFKPPQPDFNDAQGEQALPDRTLPSSPPLYQYEPDEDIDRLLELADEDDHDFPEQVTPSPSPRRGNRSTHFRSTSNGNHSFLPSLPDENYVDESPLQHVGAIGRQKVSLSAPRSAGGSLRNTSGQTDIHNEDFSPIFIGRQDEDDGEVKFGAMEIPIGELQSKLARVEQNQEIGAENDQLRFRATLERDSELAIDRFTRNAGQINLRRGGRSGDGSFYSRALSPDLGVDTSEMLPEESLQASTPKEFPTIRTELPSRGGSMKSPSLPRAPFPSPDKRSLNPSGSPLKLFGPYDTFTNQTLLRRISQYEDVESENSSGQGSAQADHSRADSIDQSRRSVSYFGGGQLDDYEFTADMSEAYDMFDGTDKENVSPEAHMIPMGSRRHMSFGNVSKLMVARRRERSGASTDAPVEMQRPNVVKDAPELRGTPARELEASDAKRSRNSPVKDPTPKRRRTLRRSDATHNRQEQLSQVDAAHQQMQNVMGKKRKDARPGQFQIADAEILAGRKFLKPCSPASSRKSSQEFDGSLTKANQTGSAPAETERKPSIKTQDFVDQAAQIMAMIRNQVKPTGLASLEESEEEHNTGADGEIESAGGSQPDSTYEPLSRPPSREGKQSPNYQERSNDPELEARLKQYKEMSDMGDIVTSSMRSVSMAQDAIRAAQDLERKLLQTTFGRASAPLPATDNIVSDLDNVRISGPFLNSSLPASPTRGYPSNSSARSANTMPTTSSSNSDSKRTIMPESVSHLIPDRVGSMYLDKSQNIWIKKKEANPDAQNNSVAPTEDSEEDPFASIPDLTVDMTQELRSLRRVMDNGNSPGARQSSPLPPQVGFIPFSPSRGEEDVEELPEMDKPLAHDTYSSNNGTTKRRNMTISFSSPIASIIQDAVARGAASFDEEATPHSIDYDKSPDQSPPNSYSGRPSLQQMDNKSRPPTMRYASQQGPEFVRRPVSPINEQDEDSTVELLANEANQLSFIGEQGLMNYGQDSRQGSLSVIISRTPGNKGLAFAGDESAIIGQNIGHMSLSPLSEFNVHQGDQSFGFEVSYVLGNRHMSTGDGSKKVMSLTLRELVERLSEVEPCEPYWQDIEELNLSEKRLTSLHMLEEFCGKVVTLDASQNALGHLEGVPSSVRQLKVSQNMLTELTSWNHLVNLQYVDISGNEVKSLSALRNLVHLRSVKADNNKLTSLDGLDSHEGLLSLRARDNLIEELDFEDSTFNRLSELDLAGNSIEVVRNMHLAPCLSKLKLSNNKLQTFEASKSCRTIRHLDVSQNKLTHLNVSGLPNLHTLLADGNQLPTIAGLQRTRRLDSLSLREQRGQEPLTLGFLSVGYEVRKLYLSGNYLESFEPKVDMLNLQLLELANCGLSILPDNLGQLMPNLRSLNINFNAICNVKPLQYIPRLKKLFMAGNRLADSTSVTQLLMDFPHITRLDTRDNPMTLGFYAPLQALVKANGQETATPFGLPDADEERDGLYVGRLDEPTKLRRRLHQVVLAASCNRLRMLDGLPMRRKQVLAMDSLLKALVEEGLVEVPEQKEKSDEGEEEEAPEQKEEESEQPQSSIWNGEDSFA